MLLPQVSKKTTQNASDLFRVILIMRMKSIRNLREMKRILNPDLRVKTNLKEKKHSSVLFERANMLLRVAKLTLEVLLQTVSAVTLNLEVLQKSIITYAEGRTLSLGITIVDNSRSREHEFFFIRAYSCF